MTLFVIETLSQFKHKYLVEAEDADAAQAIWQQHQNDNDFYEADQQWLGEMDIGLRKVVDVADEVPDYMIQRADLLINRSPEPTE